MPEGAAIKRKYGSNDNDLREKKPVIRSIIISEKLRAVDQSRDGNG